MVWSTSALSVTAITIAALVIWTMRTPSVAWQPAGVGHLIATGAAVVAARSSTHSLWGYRVALAASAIALSILTCVGGIALGWVFLPALLSVVLAGVA